MRIAGRQMKTVEIHHKTADFQVETKTGYDNQGKRVTEIVVTNLHTARAEFRDIQSVERAIKMCNNTQAYRDKLRAEAAAEQAAEEKAEAERKAAEEAAKARGPLATDRQVNYIMSLLAQTDGQNTTWYTQGPTRRAEVELMTRRDASTYISALLGQ